MSGSLTVLNWLLTVTAPWADHTKLGMLNHAAWFDKLAAVQWLRARGAKWPTKFSGEFTSADLRTIKTVLELGSSAVGYSKWLRVA
jgi:hypothetical protein